jgi:PAS domain S-box-containing protein
MKPPEFRFWNSASLNLKGLMVLVLPVAVLGTALAAAWWVAVHTRSDERRVQETFRVRADLQEIQTLLATAATGMRDYLLTGKDQYLEPYLRAQTALVPVQADLSARLAESGQLQDLNAVNQLAARELELLSVQRAAAGPPGRDALPVRTEALLHESTEVVDSLRAKVRAIEAFQDRQAAHGLALLNAGYSRLFGVVGAGALFGLLGSILVSLLFTNSFLRRVRRLEQNARLLARGEPLLPALAGTDELARLGHELDGAAALLHLRDRELQEGERRFRLLFEQAPVAFHEIDREGAIRRVNDAACRLLGYNRDELLGRPVWELVPPEQQESTRAAVGRKLHGEQQTTTFECQYVHKDGAIVSVEIHETLIAGEADHIDGLRSALLEVAERRIGELAGRKVKQYAQELRAKNEQLARALATARKATEAKNRFLASMSHELRTPLNGIIGFSELMYDGKVGPVPEAHKEFLGDILTSARHLLDLINDVLDLAKVESGRMEFRPERVDLNALVQEVRDILRPLADKKQILIDFTPAAGLGEIVADAARFKQVLYNYFSNAVKFTPAGGRVTARLALENKAEFRVEVEDTGIGISAEDASRLFQDFQQLAGARQEQGTGLGLSLTRRIVEAQGGRVGLRSVPGKGSTFYAILPRFLTGLSGMLAAPPADLPAASALPAARNF